METVSSRTALVELLLDDDFHYLPSACISRNTFPTKLRIIRMPPRNVRKKKKREKKKNEAIKIRFVEAGVSFRVRVYRFEPILGPFASTRTGDYVETFKVKKARKVLSVLILLSLLFFSSSPTSSRFSLKREARLRKGTIAGLAKQSQRFEIARYFVERDR